MGKEAGWPKTVFDFKFEHGMVVVLSVTGQVGVCNTKSRGDVVCIHTPMPRQCYHIASPAGEMVEVGMGAWLGAIQDGTEGPKHKAYSWNQNRADCEAIDRIATPEEALQLADQLPAAARVIREWLDRHPEMQAESDTKAWFDAL